MRERGSSRGGETQGRRTEAGGKAGGAAVLTRWPTLPSTLAIAPAAFLTEVSCMEEGRAEGAAVKGRELAGNVKREAARGGVAAASWRIVSMREQEGAKRAGCLGAS